jgi:phosphinothricin acetyltransferase
MVIRPASETDFPGVLEIVNQEILGGTAHFGTTPSTEADCRAWLEASRRYPWLVAAHSDRGAGEVLGFARAMRWKEREAYDRTVEIGVYVRDGLRGRGVGRALYEALFERLDEAGFHTVLAGIALPNPASVRLHERCGMRHVGTLPRVGFKLGRWIDVGYWVMHLPGEPRGAADA